MPSLMLKDKLDFLLMTWIALGCFFLYLIYLHLHDRQQRPTSQKRRIPEQGPFIQALTGGGTSSMMPPADNLDNQLLFWLIMVVLWVLILRLAWILYCRHRDRQLDRKTKNDEYPEQGPRVHPPRQMVSISGAQTVEQYVELPCPTSGTDTFQT